jgi:hypothetical protein
VREEETWQEMSMNFVYRYLFHTVWIFNMQYYLARWDRWLYFPSKEALLCISVTLKNPLSLARLEPANGSIGKYSNQ